ncbi:HD-GYP domain-containing protein [Herbaspirillum sp. CF444]|uniref:HD-GYP domain-containing protein n=1 Tax=Herbaspirillum sp. CF444 TaxID=1144319 RepID=UPI000272734F|nr:HD-GYP domain-containing protein [Herbaspirillum sp. CF444]EJL93457.1 HD-GYP domain-containing protein [Herbaspirillum sp. CF444]
MSRLKKIKVEQLELGMYFCGFEASWIDHPFWRNRFLLKDAAHLQQARASGISHCWIDIDQGKDIVEEAVEDEETAPSTEVEVANAAEEAAPVVVEADPFFAELEQARMLCESAKDTTKAMFSDVRLGKVLDMDRCLHLVAQVTASILRDSSALTSIVRLKIADDYTYMHSVAVCTLMVALGRTLGMDEVACKEAGLAGLLHDVGKAFIPVEILHKPGGLTPAEFEVVKRHTVLGYDHLVKNSNIPDYATDVCRHHHEKVDGSGYPDGLSGAGIALLARMTSICDVYDAVTSERPYKKGWDPAETLTRMATWTGHFDKTILSAFVKMLGIYPIGSLLKMESGRLGLVIRQSSVALTKPVVKAFRYTSEGEITDTEVIDLSSPDATDSIRQRGGEEWLKYNGLDKLWMQRTPQPQPQ